MYVYLSLVHTHLLTDKKDSVSNERGEKYEKSEL